MSYWVVIILPLRTTSYLSTPASIIILPTLNFKWMSSLMPLPLHGSLISVTPLAFTFTCSYHDLEVSSFETWSFNNLPSKNNLIFFQHLLRHPSILISLIELNLLDLFFPISQLSPSLCSWSLVFGDKQHSNLLNCSLASILSSHTPFPSSPLWQYSSLDIYNFLFSAPITRRKSATEEAKIPLGTISMNR